jgi:uncharacterized protein (DUF305 family)
MGAARIMVVPLALIAAAALGGCSAGDRSADAAAGPGAPAGLTATASGWAPDHNETDTNFALELVSRSDRATRLTGLVPQRTNSAPVAQYAASAAADDRRRRDQLDVLLRRWCMYVPADATEAAAAGADPDETELHRATGTEFDRQFLALMIANHESAMTVSSVELRDGRNAEAKAFAQTNIELRRTEISTARGLLDS